MQEEIAAAWNKYWQRDQEDRGIEDWPEIQPFMTCMEDCPTLPQQPLEIETWDKTLRRILAKSARGACGYSKRELLLMPTALKSILLDMLTSIENGSHWPQLWGIARVVCLKKGENATSPMDTRPITIMSRIYRTWSTYRSMQVMQHLAQMMPPEIKGCVGQISDYLQTC